MYNLFQPGVAADTINRLAQLSPDAKKLWGKIDVSQMLAQCQVPLEVALGEREQKRSIAGVFFGGIAKKQMLMEGPLKEDLPTDSNIAVKTERNFYTERKQLQTLLQRIARNNPPIVVAQAHPYFGKLTTTEWGIILWKHLDHHLQQFGV